MMQLYLGGAFQGQEELARIENPECEIIRDFHELVRAELSKGNDPRKFALDIAASDPDVVIVSDEVDPESFP